MFRGWSFVIVLRHFFGAAAFFYDSHHKSWA
jgi:hypothetical protein